MNTIKFRQYDLVNRKMTQLKELKLPWEQKRGGKMVMMFTGLLDRHGKEIYESDIIKKIIKNTTGTHEMIGEVKWDKNYACFWIIGEDYRGITKQDFQDLQGSKYWCEIIGNIYENPKLK